MLKMTLEGSLGGAITVGIVYHVCIIIKLCWDFVGSVSC